MWGKIARWLLPVSLALNIFFVVLAVRHHPFWHPRPPDAGHIADFMTPGLPPADAAILQQSFAAHAGAMDEARKAGQDFPEKIRAALTANPFDPAALQAALKEGQSGHQAMEVFQVPAGRYGIVVIHDENGNHKLDRNLFGYPKEGFGFANNPKIGLSAASFKDASVNVGCPETQVEIQLIYK